MSVEPAGALASQTAAKEPAGSHLDVTRAVPLPVAMGHSLHEYQRACGCREIRISVISDRGRGVARCRYEHPRGHHLTLLVVARRLPREVAQRGRAMRRAGNRESARRADHVGGHDRDGLARPLMARLSVAACGVVAAGRVHGAAGARCSAGCRWRRRVGGAGRGSEAGRGIHGGRFRPSARRALAPPAPVPAL